MREFQYTLPDQGLELLSTKLALPHPRSTLMPREALFTVLDGSLEFPLTLLSAPAGSGKTTVVSTWIASRNAQQERFKVAWVSLDAQDNDPVRFWHYVIAACRRFDPGIGGAALERFQAAQALPLAFPAQLPFETILTWLINDLDRLTGQHVLVLEDYHLIAFAQLHHWFIFFLEHLPATVHILLLSRSDPPLPLARWRAQGLLLELRASNLHFSLEETRTFFHQHLSLPLSQELIARLYERTGGWEAGLHLAALALNRLKDGLEQEHFITTLTGGYQPLSDYLISDVLHMQPEPLQLFLLQTSWLKRLTASLCEMVTGRSDSQSLLEQIERANLFLEPLDGAGTWYRYHALFAEAMQHEARRRLGVEELRDCYRQASLWYEQHLYTTEAIEAALMARDFTRAAILIEQQNGSSYASAAKELYTLRRWFEQLPLSVLQQYPNLYLLSIVTAMFDLHGRIFTNAAQFEKVEALLRQGESLWHDPLYLQGLYALRALLSAWREDFKQAGAFARHALTLQFQFAQRGPDRQLVLQPRTQEKAPDEKKVLVRTHPQEKSLAWHSACLSMIAAEEHFFGSLEKALALLWEALEIHRQAEGSPYEERPIRLELAEIYIEQGELLLAAETYQYILTEAGEDYFDRSKALLGLARISYERNMLDVAWQQAQEARELAYHISDEKLEIQAQVVLARVMCAQGQVEQGSQRFSELAARAQVHPSPLLYREVLFFALSSLRNTEALSASIGAPYLLNQQDGYCGRERKAIDVTTGQDSERDNLLPRSLLIQYDLLQVRCLMRRGEMQEALALLEQCYGRAQQHGYRRCMIEAQMLLALVHFQQNNVSLACSDLQDALSLVHSKGYQRLFLDEGESMALLLRTCGVEQREPSTLPSSSQAVEPLSVQEQRVLRLFIAGLTKAEIASELVISINTVKTHLQRIYRKLGATNRAEVREVIRRLRLL